MSRNGYFISFEGVEGCGKTTQIKLLRDILTTQGRSVVLTREPGGCPIADKIRSILLDAENRHLAPLAELMLYAAARAQHVTEVIMPALKDGQIVLCDRFCDATIAYQSFGRGLDRSLIDNLNGYACQGVTPDLTILVDCDTALGLSRAKQRIETTTGPREERFELEELAFHERVRAGYLHLCNQFPERFVVVNGAGTIENIAATIAQQVALHLPELSHAVC